MGNLMGGNCPSLLCNGGCMKYQIEEKEYIQKPLVLGQIRQLSEILKDMILPKTENVSDWVMALSGKLSEAIGVVLIDPDVPLKDKDLQKFSRDIEFSIQPEMACKVIEDFFDCNPIASLAQKLEGMVSKASEATGRMLEEEKIGLRESASSSQEQTSPEETPSSGDTRSASAPLT